MAAFWRALQNSHNSKPLQEKLRVSTPLKDQVLHPHSCPASLNWKQNIFKWDVLLTAFFRPFENTKPRERIHGEVPRGKASMVSPRCLLAKNKALIQAWNWNTMKFKWLFPTVFKAFYWKQSNFTAQPHERGRIKESLKSQKIGHKSTCLLPKKNTIIFTY